MPRRLRVFIVLSLCLLAACQRDAAPPVAGTTTRPAQAVRLLARRLRANDLAGFAQAAVPPALHRRLDAGWRDGRSRWPLDEVPLDERLPQMLGTLSAPGSEARLQATFDRQFARADKELKAAAVSLGQFGMQYVRNEGDYSDAERQHHLQDIAALSRWGMTAPLADPPRARATILELARAARRTGIAADEDFGTLGIDASLTRLGPFLAVLKRGFARYGLDLDATLDRMQATLLDQTGDTARVRLRYRLGEGDVDTVLALQRIDGRWYLRDYLRRAEASLQPGTAETTTLAGTAP
jgi:hypothetical protein